jgi:hypothetical protein
LTQKSIQDTYCLVVAKKGTMAEKEEPKKTERIEAIRLV